MRMIAKFHKSGKARYVSHLDLLRAVQRAIRRAELPVKYSSGFNPHQILAFASAMSVGMASEGEWMDVALDKEMSETAFFEALSPEMPPELRLIEAHAVDDRFPALMSVTAFADYRVELRLPQSTTKDEVRQGLAKMLERPILAVKKGKAGPKEVDLRKFIADWDCESIEPKELGSDIILRIRLVHAPSGALNPDLLLPKLVEAWALDPAACRLRTTRTEIWAKDGEDVKAIWK